MHVMYYSFNMIFASVFESLYSFCNTSQVLIVTLYFCKKESLKFTFFSVPEESQARSGGAGGSL